MLVDHPFVEENLVKNGPEADPVFTQDLNEALSLFLSSCTFGVAIFKVIISSIIHVVSQTCNTSMSEKFDSILKFKDLRVSLVLETVAHSIIKEVIIFVLFFLIKKPIVEFLVFFVSLNIKDIFLGLFVDIDVPQFLFNDLLFFI